jgi:hypothetical protein
MAERFPDGLPKIGTSHVLKAVQESLLSTLAGRLLGTG